MANRRGAGQPGRRSFWVALGVILGVLVYAYGFSATEVNLDQIRDETRRDRLENILRALARPELIEYDEDETNTDLAFAMPCGETDDVVVPEPGDRYLVATPDCAEPRSEVTIEGFGFSPNRELSLYFVPASEVELRLAQVRADGAGHFSTVVRLPNRPAETDQTIRAISIETVGAPRFTQTARDTLDKIIETVFLALIATTFATLLSVPLSFLAARNLMRDISSPIANVALGLIAAPLGVVAGVLAAGRAAALTSPIDSPLLAIAILVVTALIVWRLVRFALPGEETARPPVAVRTIRVLALATAAVGTLVALYLLAFLSLEVGEWLAARLGFMAFLGSFIATMGELLEFGTVVLAALVGAAVLVIVANRLGHAMRRRLPRPTMQALNLPLGALAGAVVAMLIARAIAWFYEWTDPARTLWIPAIAGAIIGIALAVRSMRRDAVGIGLGIYYVTRTIFNVLRAIEPLIMAIVFVVWVGIGPFAGALALALHTIAALAKLYSEQVESISAGPLEAIRATGANRLQTVVYAVVPQVVPPYISFTMYRWDINVRMSTIIGFVGGGGIGFLLQQNINLLNYPAAAAQILAIAIVVSAMDWLSSKVRERYV